MKLIIIATTLMVTIVLGSVWAADPAVSVKDVAIKDVRVLFADVSGLTENSTIINAQDWSAGIYDHKTTIKEMIQQGWKLQNMTAVNAKQFYFVFVK